MRSVVLMVAVAVALVSAAPVHAGAEDEAERLIQKGVALRREGKDFDAAGLFEKAYGLARTPRAAAQLGLVEQALGRWADAELHLNEALAAGQDPWIKKNRSTLMTSLGVVEEHVGAIELRGEPTGADVVVNGRSRGQLPLAGLVRVAEGFVEIEISARDFVTAKRTLQVTGGSIQQLYVKLDRVAQVSTVAPPPPARDEPAVAVSRADAESTEGSGPWLRYAGFAAGGVGVLGVATGVYMSMRVQQLEDDVANAPDPATDRALRDDGERAATLQWVAYGIGAAGLVAGGILYYLGSRPSSNVAVVPTPGGAATTLVMRF